jgi:hypothetical protein
LFCCSTTGVMLNTRRLFVYFAAASLAYLTLIAQCSTTDVTLNPHYAIVWGYVANETLPLGDTSVDLLLGQRDNPTDDRYSALLRQNISLHLHTSVRCDVG